MQHVTPIGPASNLLLAAAKLCAMEHHYQLVRRALLTCRDVRETRVRRAEPSRVVPSRAESSPDQPSRLDRLTCQTASGSLLGRTATSRRGTEAEPPRPAPHASLTRVWNETGSITRPTSDKAPRYRRYSRPIRPGATAYKRSILWYTRARPRHAVQARGTQGVALMDVRHGPTRTRLP